MKSITVKQVRAEGFTLVEMLLVLIMISMIVMLLPLSFIHSSSTLQMKVESLRYDLLNYQNLALMKKEPITIVFREDTMLVNEESISLSMRCDRELRFNEQGNVNRAMRIHCFDDRYQHNIVIQLGSGRMYVE